MSLTLDKQILSDITVYTKYAKYLPNKERRETWHELVTRNMGQNLCLTMVLLQCEFLISLVNIL